MEINKRCKWCGSPFIAQKVSTQFCSHRCANASYKKKKRNAKLEKSLEEDAQLHPLELKGTMDKPYLSPLEVANYFGVSKATIYRYLANGLIKSLQLRRSTLIRKADIDALFDLAPVYKKRSYRKRENTSYYTIKEIIEKYKISKKAILRRCDKLSIPKIYEGRNVFFNKATIDTHFAELIEVFNVENYYTPSQLMEKYSLSKAAVLSFVSRHNIPRITRGRDVYYSKVHVDTIKHKMDDLDPVDIMIKENGWICPIKPTYQDQAYYSISKNEIVVPEKQQFKDGESFYGTLFHEMVHSTGAEQHLDRFKPNSGFGSSEYAREELVAELGSALVAQRYGMTKNIKEDSCAYLKSWLDSLKESPQFIKTTLLDVKRATSMVTQRVDAIEKDLSDRLCASESVVTDNKEPEEVDEEVTARSTFHR